MLLLECLIKFCMDFCLDKATAEMKIRNTPLRRKDDFDLESDQESNLKKIPYGILYSILCTVPYLCRAGWAEANWWKVPSSGWLFAWCLFYYTGTIVIGHQYRTFHSPGGVAGHETVILLLSLLKGQSCEILCQFFLYIPIWTGQGLNTGTTFVGRNL